MAGKRIRGGARGANPGAGARAIARVVARGAALGAALVIAHVVAAPAAGAASPSASAIVEPDAIVLGDRARLVVTITDAQSTPTPAVPPIDGLVVRSAGQQMNMSIVNGATTVNVTHTFVVEATRAGKFTIPALRVEVDGRPLYTQPLALEVLPPGQAPAPRAQAPGAPAAPSELASLELVLPDRDLFAGEVVPAALELRIREGLRVTEAAQPVVDAKSFAVTRQSDRQPEQRNAMVGGVRQVIVTFPLALSPISAGEHPIDARIELRAMLPRTQGRADPRSGSLFDSFFGSIGEPRKLDVIAPTRTLRVLRLPDAGRPADFAGAIGKFTIAARAEPAKLALGDPVSLEITISGSGNFDRVVLPPLESSGDWKTYPETSAFAPSDGLGLSGRKTFEQAIVPQSAALRAIPPRTFSFFDPEARRYATVATQPIALAIAPSAERPASTGRAAGAARADRAPGDAFELAPNEIALGAFAPRTPPLATRPAFLLAQGLPWLGLAAAFWWARRRERRDGDVAWQRARAARPVIRAQLDAMERAARAGDRAAFFAAGRRAVQEEVAARHGRVATALTVAEIEACLGTERSPAPADVRDELRALFAEADAASYAGGATGAADLEQWRERILRLAARLEAA